MKILEAQSAALTNFEVQQHLLSQKARYENEEARGKRKVPDQLRTLTIQMIAYFNSNPNPLSQHPSEYNGDQIAAVVERLAPFGLTKGEMIMMINLRPSSGAAINACVEDVEERFSEPQRDEMCEIVAQTLGRFPLANDVEMEPQAEA